MGNYKNILNVCYKSLDDSLHGDERDLDIAKRLIDYSLLKLLDSIGGPNGANVEEFEKLFNKKKDVIKYVVFETINNFKEALSG